MAVAQGDGWADGDFGRLRASNTDRERAVDVLKAAFAEGRLTKEEYDDRIANVFASRTYAELAALTSDVPAGSLGTRSPSDAPMYLARRGRNGIAVASLVLGLAQPFTLATTAIPAIVCGYVARRQIRQTGESGMAMATTGLVFGWLGVAFWTLLVIIGIVALVVAAPHSP
jgi:DUF1707 SHOCT-like domain/Domain of unknown function (DUF4190)